MSLFKSNPLELESLKQYLSTRFDQKFCASSPAYLFTNENQYRVFSHLDLTRKDVLAVCAGSGDFAFNAKLFGAQTVDQFDISTIVKYVYEIKHQALNHLTYREFVRVFYDRKHLLNTQDVLKFKSELSDQAHYILTRAMNSDYSREWVFRLVYGDQISWTYPKKNPYLLSASNYQRVRDALDSNPVFYKCGVTFVPGCLSKKYDVIYLSNIGQYARDVKMLDRWVIRRLSPHLYPDGQIVCYQLNGPLPMWTAVELKEFFPKTSGWDVKMHKAKAIGKRPAGQEWDDFFVLQKRIR